MSTELEPHTYAVAALGALAAFATLIDRVIGIRDKLTADHNASVQGEQRKRSTALLPFLLREEVIPIVSAGILLNYLGLTLAVSLKSVLYLDMAGTALASFLLGPWWGALTGLLSNSFVNYLLYPESNAEIIIFPWSLVNMTGGIFWGVAARRLSFRSYFSSSREEDVSPITFLVVFGVGGAFVMAIVGTFVQAAIGDNSVLAIHPTVSTALDSLIEPLASAISPLIGDIGDPKLIERVSWGLAAFVQNWIRYIPDKTLSAAFGVAAMYYAFPILTRHYATAEKEQRMRDGVVCLIVLAVAYVPSYIVLMAKESSWENTYWALWSAPLLVVFSRLVVLMARSSKKNSSRLERENRRKMYARLACCKERQPTYKFFKELRLATIVASVLFLAALPLLGDIAVYQVAWNFFRVIFVGLLAFMCIKFSIVQHISLASEAATLGLPVREDSHGKNDDGASEEKE